jgi:hypothetical protein
MSDDNEESSSSQASFYFLFFYFFIFLFLCHKHRNPAKSFTDTSDQLIRLDIKCPIMTGLESETVKHFLSHLSIPILKALKFCRKNLEKDIS